MSLSTDNLLPRRGRNALQLAGIQMVATDELEELVAQRRILVHAECQRMIGPGAVHIHHDRASAIAGDLVRT